MGTERSFGDWQEYSGFNYKAGTLDADWGEWEDRAGIVSHGATNGSLHRGRRVLSGAGPYTFGHFRGPLWRFCEAVFTLDPPESRIPGRGRSVSTNSPQICQLQVTGFRRPHRGPPDGAAGQGGSGRELQLVGVTRASVEGLALVVHVARELQGNQGAPEHVAPGRGGGMWEGLWE